MSLILSFHAVPRPPVVRHVANNGLICIHRDMSDGDPLLAATAMLVQRLERRGEAAHEFVRLAQIVLPAFSGLLRQHASPKAFDAGVMGCQQLHRSVGEARMAAAGI